MSQVIYCNNSGCQNYRKLKSPVLLKRKRIQQEDDVFGLEMSGRCNVCPRLRRLFKESFQVVKIGAICELMGRVVIKSEKALCYQSDCLWNTSWWCTRDEIGINKNGHCESFANRTIKGHMDWSRNLDSEGHPKGGHISDDYRVDKPGTIKSFRTHTKSVPELKNKV